MKFYFLIIIILIFQSDLIYGKNDSSMIKNIRFEISTEKSNYKFGEDIFIQYKFTNISKTTQKIMIFPYWKFPQGMGASIINCNDSNICKYFSMDVLTSTFYTEKQLKKFYKRIKPGEFILGRVKLQDIPIFRDYIKNKLIPVDKYTVSLSFYSLISNSLMIEIEK